MPQVIKLTNMTDRGIDIPLPGKGKRPDGTIPTFHLGPGGSVEDLEGVNLAGPFIRGQIAASTLKMEVDENGSSKKVLAAETPAPESAASFSRPRK